MTPPEHEDREVASHDPSLTPETNARITTELREIVGAEHVQVPTDRPHAEAQRHATHSATTATFFDLRVGGILTAFVLLVTLGVWWISSSRSVLVIVPVLIVEAVLVLVIITMVNRITRQREHLAPSLSAQLEQEGVGDPDRYITELVSEFTPADRRPGLKDPAKTATPDSPVSAEETTEPSA